MAIRYEKGIGKEHGGQETKGFPFPSYFFCALVFLLSSSVSSQLLLS